MMESPNNTIKTDTPKKPLVVIKKGSIYRPNTPLLLRVPLKRAITTVPAAETVINAKRTCVAVPDPARSVRCTYIINNVTPKKTEANSNDATNSTEVTSTTSIPHPKGVTEQKVLDQSNETPEQSHAIKKAEPVPKHKTSKTKPSKNRAKKRPSQLYISKLDDPSTTGSTRCQKHDPLPKHEAEGLLTAGDTFKSLQEFEEYNIKHAPKWFFYYTRNDSRNLKTSTNYNSKMPTYLHYFCRFNKNNYKSRSKGIRKRSESKLNCSAGVTLKCHVGKDEYTVLSVCHHHTHELSAEIFNKTPHGHRLPQELKDEIRDLALFNVDAMIARRYIESKMPGLSMKKTVYNRYQRAKKCSSKNAMPPERVEEMLAKIKYIKANFTAQGPVPKTAKERESCSSHQVVFIPQKATEKTSKNKVDEDKMTCDQELIKSEKHVVPKLDQRSTEEQVNASDTSMQNLNHNADEDITDAESMIDDSTIKTEDGEADVDEVDLNVSKVESNEDLTKAPTNKTMPPQANKLELFPIETRCQKRHVKFPEHKAEGLVQVGYTFASMEDFARYAAAHALKWFFYYQVHDSRNVKTTERYNSRRKTWYNLTCRFNKGWYKSTSTGIRKIKRKTIRCPAMISMVCNPGEDKFKVIYACHHHSHELSYEIFSQEAHGLRLSPELKEEIRELVWFQLDRRIMRQYLQNKTGFDLKATIKNVHAKMRHAMETLHVTPEKEYQLLQKIEEIKRDFPIPKRARQIKNETNHEEEDRSESEDEASESRLEARLNNILYDEELIQSVRELQESTGCEIQIVPSVDVKNENYDVSHLQAGLSEDTNCCELQPFDCDNNDSRVEIDQQLYTMDENVHYMLPSDYNGTDMFTVDNINQQCDEVVYTDDICTVEENIQSTPNIDDAEVENNYENDYQTMYQYTNNEGCNVGDENSEHTIYVKEYNTNDENCVNENCVIENESSEHTNYVEENNTNDDDCVIKNESSEHTNYVEENNTNDENCVFENESSEHTNHVKEYNTNDEDCNIEDESSEHTNYVKEYNTNDEGCNIEDESSENTNYVKQYIKETHESRDVGVQADFEIIELERNFEKVKDLESEIMKQDLEQNIVSASTRGRPKVVLEEGVINRYNIELYINVGGIIPCLEQLAANMDLSVLNLLNKLYKGEAVFKLTLGRSGKQDRRTVQLTYVPLTIAIPYDKLKYINSLQEYKNICSKYSDMTMKLENTIESMSEELKDTKEKLQNIESQKNEFVKVMKDYEILVKDHALNQQLLKKSQGFLEDVQNENKVLIKKIKHLEFLQINQPTATTALDQQLLKNCQDDLARAQSKNQVLIDRVKYLVSHQVSSKPQNKSIIDNTIQNQKSKVLAEKTHNEYIKLIARIKTLERELKFSKADVKLHKEKINDVEELYFLDSKSLLDKIASLEKELSTLRVELKNTNRPKQTNPSSSSLQTYESENRKLRKEIKELKKRASLTSKTSQDQVKLLENTVMTLNKRLDEEKLKNFETLNCYKTDPLA